MLAKYMPAVKCRRIYLKKTQSQVDKTTRGNAKKADHICLASICGGPSEYWGKHGACPAGIHPPAQMLVL